MLIFVGIVQMNILLLMNLFKQIVIIPGQWDGHIERIEYLHDLIITVVHVFSSDHSLSFHVVSFIKLKDQLIMSIDEYWGDDGMAPQWRLDKHIGTPIIKKEA